MCHVSFDDSDRDLLHRVFTEKRVGIYAGVDPTAPSLHIGHMLPFMVLAWAYVWGLPAFFLVSNLLIQIYFSSSLKGGSF